MSSEDWSADSILESDKDDSEEGVLLWDVAALGPGMIVSAREQEAKRPEVRGWFFQASVLDCWFLKGGGTRCRHVAGMIRGTRNSWGLMAQDSKGVDCPGVGPGPCGPGPDPKVRVQVQKQRTRT